MSKSEVGIVLYSSSFARLMGVFFEARRFLASELQHFLTRGDYIDEKIKQYWTDKNQLSIDKIPTNIMVKNI